MKRMIFVAAFIIAAIVVVIMNTEKSSPEKSGTEADEQIENLESLKSRAQSLEASIDRMVRTNRDCFQNRDCIVLRSKAQGCAPKAWAVSSLTASTTQLQQMADEHHSALQAVAKREGTAMNCIKERPRVRCVKALCTI